MLMLFSWLSVFSMALGSLSFLGDSPWNLAAVTLITAFAFVQIVFVAHDASHHAIFESKRANQTLMLLLFNLVLGGSRSWFTQSHTRDHHSHTNDMSLDPNIYLPALILERGQSSKSGFWRFVAANQRLLLFPTLVLEGMKLRAQYTQYLLQERPKGLVLELLLMALNAGFLIAMPFYVLPLIQGLIFIGGFHFLAGVYMGLVFTADHTGLPVLHEGIQMDFFTQQVQSTRFIKGPRFYDFLCGGLNYHVEHHLFPTMPRFCFAQAQQMVKEVCVEEGLVYEESGLLSCYLEMFSYFDRLQPTAQDSCMPRVVEG